ncbi:hypothetical protein ACFV90_40795 [Streptomyces sp. NPDC059904]|uniref:hypothetical protein n=1 Tax=Streptomyces sp. NPDC059904 TaxID=3346996 RepID=UPI003651F1BF
MSDTWKGQPLSDAQPVQGLADEIHYRIHAVDDGELLGFGTASGAALDGALRHYLSVQREHPGRRILIRQYDGSA